MVFLRAQVQFMKVYSCIILGPHASYYIMDLAGSAVVKSWPSPAIADYSKASIIYHTYYIWIPYSCIGKVYMSEFTLQAFVAMKVWELRLVLRTLAS